MITKPLLLRLIFTILAALLPAVTPGLNAQVRPPEAFVVTSEINSATPFNITLPSTDASGRRVKTVSIEFVTSECDAPTGTTIIGPAKLRVEFHGNFAFYTLPFAPPLLLSNFSEFVSAQKTLIFADPGSRLDYGLPAGQPSCTVVFSGYLTPH